MSGHATGRTIRTAVLGFGVSGRVFHSPLLAANPDYSLRFITTSNEERSRQARELHPKATILKDPEDVFKHADEIDLVIIGTPPANHYELANAAIDHGLHVVVDKPFVPTAAQGEELIQKAESAGVSLTVFQNRRWDADFLTVQDLVRQQVLGSIATFESRFEWWQPDGFRSWKGAATLDMAGGILYDLGSHLIDQALQLFGPVQEVYGQTTRYTDASTDADEDAFVILQHTNGTRSRLTMSGLAALPGPRFHIFGSRGTYLKWGLDGQEPALDAGKNPNDADYGIEAESAWGSLSSGAAPQLIPAQRGDYPQFYKLLSNHLADGTPLPADPKDAVQVLHIIEEVHRAAG
ncbi:Gfo/Idh/MocA family oxidoreductase [Arthrobacter sp. EH-1B-1]|uniref:Gfo/Idh/MocA family oxidoreductase n=1 Tax=Arthrobacter vasquezii TaxID=2977629 RepID=A0ABT6CUG5_9MICC|nr:Gfo/Idh/MocA family oxidoreductase [Arthrobacter vasquezii]MDF9277411.1 Gfo/Idh/MocA family oxidoreductase [Arthrobacter vasquezii]